MTIRHRCGCGDRPSAGLRRWGFILLPAVLLAGASPRMAAAQVQASDNARQITVDEAVEIALRRNPRLIQAYSTIEMAEHNRLSAYGALLPGVNAFFSYSNSSTGRLDALSQGIVATSYSTRLQANYTLFDGWGRFTNLKSARLGVVEQNARYREAEFQVIQQVKQAYAAAVATRDLVAVEERRVQRQADQLEFVRQQLELGRATRSDSLRSQVDLNNAQLALLTEQNNARTRTFELTEVIGSETLVGPTVEAELAMAAIPYTRDELFAMADVAAPALEAASLAVEAAEAAVSGARSSYLPTISLGAGYGWANQEFPPSNRSWSIGLSGSYPLFNGFQRETQLFRARASADQARQEERAVRLNISSLLDARYATAQSALAGVDLAERNVELSEESLRVVQERYQLGLATILELQDAQITLTQAEVDLVRGRFDYEVAVAGIEALLGRRLDPQP
ncbi:MAG: TolC family protein [Gemmatimonadales bacterium]|nr:TolC family protein [Candidatus Palauibacter denitrificans]